MKIETLKLVGYRNYKKDAFFHFGKGINVVCGKNAQGKTNLIEAIYLLSRGYSHRLSTLKDAVNFDSEGFFAEATLNTRDTYHRLSLKVADNKRSLLLDGKNKVKREDVFKIFNTVLFEPDDLKIVKDGPDKRRRFLDIEIAAFKPHYAAVIAAYKKVLGQRGALLKDIRAKKADPELLPLWDHQLAAAGAKVIGYRIDYLRRLNQKSRQLHKTLSEETEILSLDYVSNVLTLFMEEEALAAGFLEKLTESRSLDIERGITRYGPHVDDFSININGKDTKKFGSQGQQRTAAISLILSQIEIYKEATGDYPIVLLDDILSELDEVRQRQIIAVLDKTQAFITCTDKSFIQGQTQMPIRLLQIENGRLIN